MMAIAAGYDRARALFPADVLLARLRDQLVQRGTLDVLRHGIMLLGLKAHLTLAQFKPALTINHAILARYAARCIVVSIRARHC